VEHHPLLEHIFQGMHYFIVSWRGWHTSLGHTLFGWLDSFSTWCMEEYFIGSLVRSNHPWHILLGHISLESFIIFGWLKLEVVTWHTFLGRTSPRCSLIFIAWLFQLHLSFLTFIGQRPWHIYYFIGGGYGGLLLGGVGYTWRATCVAFACTWLIRIRSLYYLSSLTTFWVEKLEE